VEDRAEPPGGNADAALLARQPAADAYWDRVGAEWRRDRPHALWREFTDGQQGDLFDRWIAPLAPAAGSGAPLRVLKTDLFDEIAGRGVVPRMMAAGADVTAIDVAPGTVAEAAALNPGLEAVVADVRSLPFAAESFDAVFSGSTLDHFAAAADIDRAIRELARVLRPGGRLVLTLDNPVNPLVRLRNGPLRGILRGLGIVPYEVGATLGPRPLGRLLDAAGLTVGEMTAVLHVPRALAVACAGPVSRAPRRWQEAFLRGLAGWERLDRWPTRWLTGYYVAARAEKR
jgi:SAM-dependent methyltransferase